MYIEPAVDNTTVATNNSELCGHCVSEPGSLCSLVSGIIASNMSTLHTHTHRCIFLMLLSGGGVGRNLENLGNIVRILKKFVVFMKI